MARRYNYEDAYKKEKLRIKRRVKALESRGYRFEAGFFEELTQRTEGTITKADVKRLQKIHPDYLYSQATALSEEGEIVSGTERRAEERRESARKGVETRRQKIEAIKNETGFDEQRKLQDEIDRQKADRFTKGKIVYDTIIDMIDTCFPSHKKSAEHLRYVLDESIDHWGFNATMESIAMADDKVLIELADVAIRYKYDSDQHLSAINEFLLVIRGGEALTAEEAQDVADIANSEEWWDYVNG